MAITHSVVRQWPTNLICSPEDWNASHLCPAFSYSINAANVTWTNQPSALTELFGNVHRRIRVDLTYASEVRLIVRVSTIGAASSVVFAQYATNPTETAWANLTSQLPIDTVGTLASAWEPPPALNDVVVRIVGQGNGVADPVLGSIQLQVR